MKSESVRSCRGCLYWYPHSFMRGMGLCDNPRSLNYNHVVQFDSEACEYYIEAGGDAESEKNCGMCHYWYPLDVMPTMGECHNPESINYGKAIFEDNLSGACYRERALEGIEFAWCMTCRETINTIELPLHTGHKIFVSTSKLPVEDIVEMTFAGD